MTTTADRSLILVQMGTIAREGTHGYIAQLSAGSCTPEVERDALAMLARQSPEMAALCVRYAASREEG